jgi:hypothetical protein
MYNVITSFRHEPPFSCPPHSNHRSVGRGQFDPFNRAGDDTHQDTIMRFMVEVGTGCEKLYNEQMQLVGRNGEAYSANQAWIGPTRLPLRPPPFSAPRLNAISQS